MPVRIQYDITDSEECNLNDDERFSQAAQVLTESLRTAVLTLPEEVRRTVQEIRLRLNRPLELVCPEARYYIRTNGALTCSLSDGLLTATKRDIEETFHAVCSYSVYSRQREIACGFVTLRGGHRAGICGTAVCENGAVANIRDLSSLSIRVAREHRGCASTLYQTLRRTRGALICGEPCSGKTTVLRDLARLFSTVGQQTVSLIDERSELAGTVGGAAQNDVGMCDVLDGYPKAEALLQAVRSLSPQLIICDEIGGRDDVDALLQCLNCGVTVIASVHASHREELFRRVPLRPLFDARAFETLVFLKGRGHAGEIASVIQAGELLAA